MVTTRKSLETRRVHVTAKKKLYQKIEFSPLHTLSTLAAAATQWHSIKELNFFLSSLLFLLTSYGRWVFPPLVDIPVFNNIKNVSSRCCVSSPGNWKSSSLRRRKTNLFVLHAAMMGKRHSSEKQKENSSQFLHRINISISSKNVCNGATEIQRASEKWKWKVVKSTGKSAAERSQCIYVILWCLSRSECLDGLKYQKIYVAHIEIERSHVKCALIVHCCRCMHSLLRDTTTACMWNLRKSVSFVLVYSTRCDDNRWRQQQRHRDLKSSWMSILTFPYDWKIYYTTERRSTESKE